MERDRRLPVHLGASVLVLVVAGCNVATSPPAFSIPPAASASAGASPIPVDSPVASRPSVAPPDAAVELVTDHLDTPVGLVAYPGRTDVELVWEQTGTVRVLQDGHLLPDLFLDLRSRLVTLMPDYDERGLLGLAFHPDFASNGRIFVYYGAPTRAGHDGDHTDRLSEFRIDQAQPLHVIGDSERVLLEFEQPQFNHSGGGLGFGPDGLLYLGTGDGGGVGDASPGHSSQGNAQDATKLNGKVLRIDVDHAGAAGTRYSSPPDNPFADGARGLPEIYALGFRNPWRLSWEPDGQHRLLVSDVGYGRYEEIDAVERSGNYGWRIREGAHCLDVAHPLQTTTDCPTTAADGAPLIDPVVEYSHTQIGIAVVGGYVYEGAALPSFDGRYVFADFTRDWHTSVAVGRGTLLVADPQAAGAWPWRVVRLRDKVIPSFITGMGRDASGELYVLVRDTLGPSQGTGRVLRLVPAG